MKRGFILGKFMPFHAGHQFLCDVASNLVDELTVLVCTRDCEPIDGALRYAWVRQSVRANVRVVHMHRNIPQDPSKHPDFWTIWKAKIDAHHPNPIDIVFGSESYITKLAQVMNAKPFIVDIDRTQVPISATQIRADPHGAWPFIPPAVRPNYQKRICVLGPESTGKTTMAHALGHTVIPEYGRDYDVQFRQGQNWEEADFPQIAHGHIALRQEIVARAGPIVVEDTDLIQTMAWADFLLGKVPDALHKIAQNWNPASRYLVLTPQTPWIDDGTRYTDDPQVRERFVDCLTQLLERYGLQYNLIGGHDWSERLRDVQAILASVTKID